MKPFQIVQKVVTEVMLPILNENLVKKNAKVEMKYIFLKFVILTLLIQTECLTEPNTSAFGIAPIKAIASIENRSDRIIKCENVLGCI